MNSESREILEAEIQTNMRALYSEKSAMRNKEVTTVASKDQIKEDGDRLFAKIQHLWAEKKLAKKLFHIIRFFLLNYDKFCYVCGRVDENYDRPHVCDGEFCQHISICQVLIALFQNFSLPFTSFFSMSAANYGCKSFPISRIIGPSIIAR